MIAKFIREYRSFYFAYLVLSGSFILLFLLYKLPTEFLQNALLLSLTLLILLTAGLFWKFRNRMRALEDYVHEEALPLLNKPVDLAYLNLIEAEKEATREQLLDYKSREEDLQAMVKMWSHQMKVPLAALSLMSQTDNLNQQDVNHQLLRLDNYMANLLNYLKLTNHASDFRFEQVEVIEVVVDLVKKYRNQFLQKDISVTIDGNWLLKTDRKWLSFALSQIIDNALKYNKTGGKVAIELNNGISISDTGIGILAEDIPRLFDEGFTGFNGREHQKATGFGLYLTKRVLNQLELAISVESQLEIGTTVSITKVQ
ncbi:sensor histidine kinase [Streptococcus suis]|uniref:sensor histidine kinase n=1 Tax=Streptococcus suis TaxID=1307 RepID=UPI000D666432|nr:sensor histidine kinase [Streptococcus suis]AWL25980.1 histidine kinase [Streptococcus suis]HEL1597907.1 sensor histidine kinase [Streptococcus suis]HEL1977138.1 sensor histidine kinase [Streptococcus suis]